MSTKKIIRQILIGAALTINATALSTLGQQQVNAMEPTKQENNNPTQTTEQEVQQLKRIVQQKSDEQVQEYGAFNKKVQEYGDKIQAIEKNILTDLSKQTNDINDKKEKLKKLNDKNKKLKQILKDMKDALDKQTTKTERLLAINDKQAAEIAQLKKDRQN